MRRVVEISTLAVLGSMPTKGSDYPVRQPLNRIGLSFLTPCLYHAPRKKGRWESSREDKVTREKNQRREKWKTTPIMGEWNPKLGGKATEKMGEREHELSNSKTGARIKGGKQTTARMI